jgi:transposase
MTKAVEVITSVQRRRRWSRGEKERIVAAAMAPGAVASDVARAAGIYASQLFRWRQQLCERTTAPAAFNSVVVRSEAGTLSQSGAGSSALQAPLAPPEPAGVIEIDFAGGGRMRITGSVPAGTVTALMRALAKGKGRR